MDKGLAGFHVALANKDIQEWYAARLGQSPIPKKRNLIFSRVDLIELYLGGAFKEEKVHRLLKTQII